MSDSNQHAQIIRTFYYVILQDAVKCLRGFRAILAHKDWLPSFLAALLYMFLQEAVRFLNHNSISYFNCLAFGKSVY
jgi:hypothetical protein